MNDSMQKKYVYELRYQNGEVYLPGCCPDHERSYIIEEVENMRDTMKYRTSLVVRDADGGQKTLFNLSMTEMTPGRIRKYVSEYTKYSKNARVLFQSTVDFSGNDCFRSVTKKLSVQDGKTKVIVRKKKGTVENYHFIGMFHYTYLFHDQIKSILKDLRQDNVHLYRDIAFKSMEINPTSGDIAYWRIFLKETEVEYRKGLHQIQRLYRLKFEADPGFLTGLYFKIRNILPEFHIWLTEDKEHIYQIEEFNSEGRKVVYQWVPDAEKTEYFGSM